MPVLDTLTTRYALDPSGYQKGARGVLEATVATKLGIDMASARASTFGRVLAEVGAGMRTGGMIEVGFAAALLAVSSAAAMAGAGLMKRAADFEALVKSLEAVEGSSEAARRELERLKNIGKMPGIGFEEAIQGYVGLKRGGLEGPLIERILTEMANQVALGGGGREEMSRVTRALQQMATKPFLQGEELMQLTEAGIPAHKLMKDIYGTSDTIELKKRGITSQQVILALVGALEKMPRVGGSAKNSFENFMIALEQAAIKAGNALNATLIPMLDNLGTALEMFTESGAITATFEKIASDVASVFDAFAMGEEAGAKFAAVLMTVSDVMRNAWINLKAIWDSIPDWMKGGVVTDLFADTYQQNLDVIEMQMRLAEQRAKKKHAGGGPKVEISVSPIDEAAPSLVENTRRTADAIEKQLDLRRYALGGGAQGAIGVTPVDRTSIARGRASTVTEAGKSIADILERAIGTEVASRLAQFRRAGAF